MPDNVDYTPGAGATIAADDIGGVLHQRVKLTHGVDGVAADVSEDQPLPVKDSVVWQLLQRIFARLSSPVGFDKSLDRQRGTVIVESGTVTTVSTVTTVTTCSTVSSLTNVAGIGGYPAQMDVVNNNLQAWHACMRSRIS